MKLKVQKTVYPDKQIKINDWFRYIHNQVSKQVTNPKFKRL